MKKLLICILSITILFACVVVCNAAGTTKTIDELDIKITIPSEFDIFTRDMEEDDAALETYRCTKSEMLSTLGFESENLYLSALYMEENLYYEIAVKTTSKNVLADFNLIGEDYLTNYADNITESYKKDGIEISNPGSYKHSQTLFFMCQFVGKKNGDIQDHALKYITVCNNKYIDITFHSYYGEITSENEEMMKEVIDSVQFMTEPQTLAPEEEHVETELPVYETEVSVYEDDELDIQIGVTEISQQEGTPYYSETTTGTEAVNSTEENDDGKSIGRLVLVIIIIAIVTLIAVLVILLFRKNSDDTSDFSDDLPDSPDDSLSPDGPGIIVVPDAADGEMQGEISKVNEGIVLNKQNFCHICGSPLIAESRYCQNCRTYINLS